MQKLILTKEYQSTCAYGMNHEGLHKAYNFVEFFFFPCLCNANLKFSIFLENFW